MSTIIITGNLTKDADVRTTEKGRKYLLLQLAENIRKRDDKGEFVKDQNGHYENAQTFYHSVFINNSEAVLQGMELKSGTPIKVAGTARFKIQKGANGYDEYVLDRIIGNYIDTDPFGKMDDAALASDREMEDVA
jgi:Single-stranded DNA-binding protein